MQAVFAIVGYIEDVYSRTMNVSFVGVTLCGHPEAGAIKVIQGGHTEPPLHDPFELGV